MPSDDGADDADGVAAWEKEAGQRPAISPMMTSQIMKVITPLSFPGCAFYACAFRLSRAFLAGQLAFQRRPEPGCDPRAGPDPLAEPLGLGCDRRGGLGSGVLEEPDHDLAVLALRPAADDPAVPPGRGADVAGPVEQRRGVLADVPAALAPAHGGGVQGGQQRRPRPEKAGASSRPGRSAASMTPGAPFRSTSATSSSASACRTCPAVRPVHHCRSETRAGPNADSHRRASSARAAAAAGRASSAAAVQVNWLEVHPPRGRPRTISPSADSTVSRRVVTLTGPP